MFRFCAVALDTGITPFTELIIWWHGMSHLFDALLAPVTSFCRTSLTENSLDIIVMLMGIILTKRKILCWHSIPVFCLVCHGIVIYLFCVPADFCILSIYFVLCGKFCSFLGKSYDSLWCLLQISVAFVFPNPFGFDHLIVVMEIFFCIVVHQSDLQLFDNPNCS